MVSTSSADLGSVAIAASVKVVAPPVSLRDERPADADDPAQPPFLDRYNVDDAVLSAGVSTVKTACDLLPMEGGTSVEVYRLTLKD